MKRTTLHCNSDYDGSEIVAHLYEPEGRQKSYSVIFGHGFSESKEKYEPIGEAFAQNGILTIIPDMRGHGESKTEFDVKAMARDEIALAKKIRRDLNVRYVALSGISMSAYTTALAQTYDQVDAEILVMVPRSFKKYVEKFTGYRPLRNSVLRALAKTPIGYAAKLMNPGLGKTNFIGGGIKFRELHVYDIRRFVDQIDNSPDIVDVYSNGFHTRTPTLLVCDHNKKDWHDGKDSEDLADIMVKNGETPKIRLHVTDDNIGRDCSAGVVKTIIDQSINFLDELFETPIKIYQA